ncbi:hypothetical protein GCM10020295_54250 [Streptomyces cinereospinus]
MDTWLPGTVRGNGHDGREVTLRQLLNHTSGIHDYTSDEEFGRTYLLKDGFLAHRYDTLEPPSWWRSRWPTRRTSRRARPGSTPTPTTSWPGW